ncbi:MAG: T9SS type A sorting domain-containing protein [Ignavibacteriae bacterium]|nr:T9SS type A sorting domain-containing protein [Ignavibacteriota bacterium]
MIQRSFLSAAIAALLALALSSLHAQSPSTADTWRQVGGPFTGKVLSLLELPDGSLLAGTERGGLFRCTDATQPWEPYATASLAGTSIYQLKRAPDGRLFAGLEYNLAISTDDGATWTIKALPSSQNGFAIAFSPSGTLYLGGWAGLHKSDDGGTSWTEIMSGLPNVSVNTVAVDAAGNIYSGHQNRGLYRSSDQGANWALAHADLDAVTVKCTAVGADGAIYAGTSGLGISISRDNGLTWFNDTNTTANITALCATSSGPVLAGGANGIVYLTRDSAASWRQMRRSAHGGSILSLSSFKNSFAAGTAWDGVMRGDIDPTSWTDMTAGLINLTVPAFTSNSKGTIFMVNPTFNDVMKSADGGNTWTIANGNQTRTVRTACVMPENDYLYVGTPNGVYHSTDDGATWTQDITGMTNRNVRLVAVSPTRAIFASCFGRKLYRSLDYGQSWSLINETFGNGEISTMIFTEDGVIFAGTETAGLYRSLDNGTTWSSIQKGLNRLLVTSLCYSKNYGLYHGSYGEVHVSSDRGDTWTRITNDLPVASVYAIAIAPSGRPAVGMEVKGCYYYDAAARNWLPANTGLFNKSILAFHVNSNGALLAGTDGNGIFIIDRVPTGIADAPAALPSTTELSLYPNPVVSSGALQVTLTTALESAARCIVVDMLGRVVYTGTLTQGSSRATLELPSLPGGVYTVQVQSATRTTSARFVIAGR